MKAIALFCVVLFASLTIGTALKCMECNAYRGEFTGRMCPEDLIDTPDHGVDPDAPLKNVDTKDGCEACFKQFTVVKMNYFKAEATISTVTSRLCAQREAVGIKDGCTEKTSNGGFTTSCYCRTDNCNGSQRTAAFSGLTVFIVSMAVVILSLFQ